MVQTLAESVTAALDAMAAGEPAHAEAICQPLLKVDADNQAVLLLLGLAIGAQGDFLRAQPILVGAAHARNRPDPRYEIASTLVRARCRPLVALLYRECLCRAPEDSRLRYYFAEFLHEAHALTEAREVLIEGLRHHPGWPGAHQLLGIVLADQGKFGSAIGQFRQVARLAPEQAGGWANLGAMLKVEGRFDAALKAYDRAIGLAPDDARIRVNRTVALLQAGRLPEAWCDFEWRLALPEHQGFARNGPQPVLPDLTQVADRTILVTHSDGFGDTLQFARYLPLLAKHGARVLAWVPKPLVRILRSLDMVAEVLADDEPMPAFDFYCPFVSLPRVFGTTLETIPNTTPYVFPDQGAAGHWASRLPRNGLLVGLVWAGQGRPYLPGFDVVDGRRSTDLATLAPLATVDNVRFVSLQMGPAAIQAHEPPPGLNLFDPMGEVADFADTAAIIANLDVVVSVDTSVVHLAGAMGKPVLMLDRYDNCWRWLSNRTDSPWYPTLRIFRQKRPDEWGPVVGRVARALRALAERRPAAAGHPYPGPEWKGVA